MMQTDVAALKAIDAKTLNDPKTAIEFALKWLEVIPEYPEFLKDAIEGKNMQPWIDGLIQDHSA